MIKAQGAAVSRLRAAGPMGTLRKAAIFAAFTSIIPVMLISLLGHTVEFARILNDPRTAANKDFVSYWAAGKLLVHHKNPYDAFSAKALEKSVGYIPSKAVIMRNPPVALALVLPFGLLGIKWAAFVWSLLIVGCVAVTVHLVWVMHGRPPNKIHMLGFVFPAALSCYAAGQTSAFALLGLAFFLYLNKAKPFLAGLCIALCAIKPHLFLPFGAVLFLWVLRNRAWRLILGAVTTLLISLAIPSYFDGALWSQYFFLLKNAGIDREFIPVVGSLLRLATNPNAMWIQFLPALLGCVWAIWYFRRNRETWDWRSHGALLLLVSLLVSPYSWFFDEIILLPAILHGIYVSANQQRAGIGFGLISSVALTEALLGAPLFSSCYMWTTAAWLVWYVLETRPFTGTRNVIDGQRVAVPVPVCNVEHPGYTLRQTDGS